MCDYTLKGLRATVPNALLSVTQYWVRKSFERADRYVLLYSLESNALPFPLREFMVKTWKRHRDVPGRTSKLLPNTLRYSFPNLNPYPNSVTIDEVVDKAYEQLIAKKAELEERSKRANIDCGKLERVNDLLHDIMLVVQFSDESQSVKKSILYAKIENLEKNASRQKETQAETERKFVQLKKKRTFRKKWRRPLSMVPELRNVSAFYTFAR
jgi:hypothetical protein